MRLYHDSSDMDTRGDAWRVREQIDRINRTLRGHNNYYGMGGNDQSLEKKYN